MATIQHDDFDPERHQTTRARSTLKSMLTPLLAALLAIAAMIAVMSAAARAEDPAAATEESAPLYSPLEALGGVRIGQMRTLELHEAPQALPPLVFHDADGALRDLSEFEGKIVVVNLWALWCPPCLTELPSIDRLAAGAAERFGDDVVVVALNIDRGGPDRPLAFLRSENLESLVFLQDTGAATMAAYRPASMPTTLILDRRGAELGRFVGPAEWDAAEVFMVLDRAVSLP